MLKRCMVCKHYSLVQTGDGDQLGVSHGVCSSADCRNIYRVWNESQFISNAYSLEEFAKQIHEERRRVKRC